MDRMGLNSLFMSNDGQTEMCKHFSIGKGAGERYDVKCVFGCLNQS